MGGGTELGRGQAELMRGKTLRSWGCSRPRWSTAAVHNLCGDGSCRGVCDGQRLHAARQADEVGAVLEAQAGVHVACIAAVQQYVGTPSP